MGESPAEVEGQVAMRRFRVAGMHCVDCAARVEHALQSVPGVENALADLDRGEVTLRASNDVTEAELAEAVEGWGYTLLAAAESEPESAHEPEPPAPEPEPEPEPEPPPPPAPKPAPQSEPELRAGPIVPEREPDEGELGYEGPPSRAANIFRLIVQIVAGGVIFSIFWVALYRFVPAPFTLTMVSETLFEGHIIKKEWVPLERISPHLIRSVIASEDYDFCHHQGFDFKELQAAWDKAQDGGRLRGASTISQQTAKNAFLWGDRSWVRKAGEAYFTMLIETLWPKRRIMEVYLNVIEFGPGTFGAEAGARKWFGKKASQLSPLEAARLAAILPNPSRYKANPAGPYINGRGYTIAARARGVDSRCARP